MNDGTIVDVFGEPNRDQSLRKVIYDKWRRVGRGHRGNFFASTARGPEISTECMIPIDGGEPQ